MESNDIEQARNYVTKAHRILTDYARPDDRRYVRRKYVPVAGRQLWAGILLALDTLIKKSNGVYLVEDYEEALSAIDERALKLYQIAYELVYFGMIELGSVSVGLSEDGLQTADELIGWVERRLMRPQ